MEFFEKAHNTKIKRKDNKSEANVKKQLKQMLYGYKHDDNEIIVKSAEAKLDFEDSHSISSLSELNTTQISGDTQASDEGKDIGKSIHILEADNDSKATDSSDVSKPSEESLRDDEISNTLDSISIVAEDVNDSLDSVTNFLESDQSRDGDTDSEVLTLNSTFSSISEIESESEPFDQDGELAKKILNKLNKTLKVKPKKRKESIFNDFLSNVESLKRIKISNQNQNGAATPDSLYDGLSIDEDSDTEALASVQTYSPNVEDEELSQPSLFVDATNLPSNSLSEVLPGNNYTLIRNIPYEMPTLINHTTDIFQSDYLIGGDANILDISLENDDNDINNDISNSSIVDTNLGMCEDQDNIVPSIEDQNDTQSIEDHNDTQSVESNDWVDDKVLNVVKVYFCKKSCLVVFKHPAELYFHGKLVVTPISGSAEVFGNILAKRCEVYAPSYNFAQCIRSVATDSKCYGSFRELRRLGLSVTDAEDLITSLGESDAVIQLEHLNSTKVDFVENNFNILDLFSKQKNVGNCLREASQMLECSFYLTKPYKCLHENPSWNQVLKSGYETYSRGLVCGGKGTGKSTFLRYYINKIINQGPVLVIDLDPGQCEFTVSGNISATIVHEPLLGPNFTHLKTPERTLHIGMINVMDNLRRYSNAVKTLIDYCLNNDQYRSMPWIVNTMGMCNTIGLKLVTLITLLLRPTFLLQMDSKNPKKRFEYYLNPHTVKRLYNESYKNDAFFDQVECLENLDYLFCVAHQYSEVASKINSHSLSPRDERCLNFLAYFGELLDTHKGVDFLGIVPYEVPLTLFSIATNVKFDSDNIHKVINGKIVSLCQQSTTDRANRTLTLDDKPMLSYGTGLIRGIDIEKGMLYILTPTPTDKLAAVDTLVYSDWAPELCCNEQSLPEGTFVPYRAATSYDQRQFMFTPRRRFNPIQLLKTRKT